MSIKTAFVVLAALTSAAAVGCSGGGGDDTSPATGTSARATLHRAKGCTDLLGDLKADAKWKLDKALDYSIDGIRACQKRNPDAQCAYYGGYGYPYGGGGVGFSDDGPQPQRTADSATTSAGSSSSSSGGAAPPASPTPASGAPSSSGSNGSGAESSKSSTGSASASTFSQTNTQVKGVDEADIVKNDGSNLYIIHGSTFKVVHAFPSTEMREAGSTEIEGSPSQMFVSDGKVVIYSQVNGGKLFAAAGVKIRAQYQEYGYGVGGVAKTTDGGDIAPPTAPGYPGGGVVDPGPYVSLTKITVLNLEGGVKPVVARESYYEGNYLDSRRVDTSVRTVFQGYSYGPTLKYSVYDVLPQPTPAQDPNTGGDIKGNGEIPKQDPSPKTGNDMIAAIEKLRAENHKLIDASVINDWLPYTFVKSGDKVEAKTTACEDFYVPTTGSTESGITEVSTLDLSNPGGAPRSTAILGRADTVYGNANTMYLATHAWVEMPFAWYDNTGDVAVSGGTNGSVGSSSGGSSGVPETKPAPPPVTPVPTPKPGGSIKALHPLADPANKPSTDVVAWSNGNTHLHKFDFTADAHFANYVASGTVRGNVKDQFSLDEKDGTLRLASTESRSYVTADGVYAQPDFNTVPKGSPAPARPQSVSHLYTLQQKGPWLETIGDAGDLAANEQIYSVRFVENRGYIVTYRQVDPLFVFDLSAPAKPNLLGELTIPGFSTYMHPIGANFLLTIGRSDTRELQLKLFDVTNGAAPRVAAELTYNGGDGSSDAEYDHKAFTYFPQADGTGYLALPFYSYNYGGTPEKGDIYGGMRSTLEIFHVDTASGIKRLGDIDATSLVTKRQNGYCGGYYGPSVRRGVFLDSTVYAITYGGIAAKDVNALDATAKTFALPAPTANDYYGAPIASCAAPPVDTGTGNVPGTEPVPQK